MPTLKIPPWIAASILAVSVTASAAPQVRPDLYGSPASPSVAQRSLTISPSTRFINVKAGEIVRFDVNDKSFAWNFTVGQNVSAIDMRRIAPPGMLDRKVVIYVMPDFRYGP